MVPELHYYRNMKTTLTTEATKRILKLGSTGPLPEAPIDSQLWYRGFICEHPDGGVELTQRGYEVCEEWANLSADIQTMDDEYGADFDPWTR
jgi:hypothetical protein